MGAKPRPTHARAADAEGAAGTTPPGEEPLLPVPTPSAVYEQLQAALAMAELHTARPGENRAKIPDLELERSAPAQTPPSGEPAVLDVPYGRVITVTVTAQAPQARRELAVVRSPNSSLAASYRILRQRIKSCGDPRVIAVAGPSWLERSDVCAVNLAMSLAEHAREPVLLLDANVRQPRLARLCEVSPPRCFGEQMVRYVEDEHEPWQVARLAYPGLHLLAVEPSQHYEHFDVLAFRSAMAELQAGPYTHIIVDCPAILDSADVSLIEDCCDAVLLVAATGLTRRSTLERAAALLAPSNLLGVVSVTL